ncbi:MAG: VanZ family protein [Blautia sp.]|nr:VanZ family protein [Blautia sp.]
MKQIKKKRWFSAVFICYLAVLLRITVFRSGFGTHGLCKDGVVNLKLFEEYLPLIQTRDWDRFLYLFIGNIIWFVPLGAYVRYRQAERGILRAAVSGFVLSLCIEAMQYIFGTGVSELDDLILNTAGAALGAVIDKVPLYKSAFCHQDRSSRCHGSHWLSRTVRR